MLHYLQFLFCDCNVVTVSYRLLRLLKLNLPTKRVEGCGAERPVKTGELNVPDKPRVQILGNFAIFIRSETNSWKLFFVLPLAVSHFRVQIVWSLVSKGSFKCSQEMQHDLSWIVLDSTVFFCFFFPKNQFWVSQFVEASMCRVNVVSIRWFW